MLIINQKKDILINADKVVAFMVSDDTLDNGKYGIGADTGRGTAIIGYYKYYNTAISVLQCIQSALLSDGIKLLEMPEDMED